MPAVAPPPPAVAVGAQSTSAPAPAESKPMVPEGPKVRDRIVVLGRTRSGKTVYIARLYQLLWESKGDLRMRACSGVTHTTIVRLWQELTDGKWPAATTATDSHSFDLTFQSREFTMVVSDYPGEVFTRAFMDDLTGAPERQLVDSIDRAQAIIFLVDPLVMIGSNLLEDSEQEFGLSQAVKRLRTTPGGEEVPIAIVVTKYDVVREQVKAAGDVKMFLMHHYPQLVSVARGGGTMVFSSAAVRTRTSSLGKSLPDWTAPARYVEEPLRACLEKVMRNAEQTSVRTVFVNKVRIASEERAAVQVAEEKDRSKANWIVALCFLVLALVVVGGAWWILRGRGD